MHRLAVHNLYVRRRTVIVERDREVYLLQEAVGNAFVRHRYGVLFVRCRDRAYVLILKLKRKHSFLIHLIGAGLLFALHL